MIKVIKNKITQKEKRKQKAIEKMFFFGNRQKIY